MPNGVRCVVRTLPVPFAVRADLRRGAGGAAGTLAVRTLLDTADVDFLLAAECCLFKGDVQAHAQIFAPARVAALLLSAAEAAAEDVAEDVTETAAENVPKAAEAAETGAAGPPADGSNAAWPNWSYFARLSGSDSTS